MYGVYVQIRSQVASEFETRACILRMWAEPDTDVLCLLIDRKHETDLVVALSDARLINTNLIDPKKLSY
jgi:hypothetical protein